MESEKKRLKNFLYMPSLVPYAYKTILAEENIGLMLPCNVIVYEKGGKTVLSVIRPTVAMQMIDNVGLKQLVEEVEGKLKKAFDAIK